jgi:hypothetical protein
MCHDLATQLRHQSTRIPVIPTWTLEPDAEWPAPKILEK